MNPKYYALLVGLTHVNPLIYGGWTGKAGCEGCKKDVRHVRTYLKNIGYICRELTNEQATQAAVVQALTRLAEDARYDDRVVFYYSGHGGQVADVDGDEPDKLDETLVLYDGQLIDDRIHDCLIRFRDGVRIIMVTDSCHSETNYRGGPPDVQTSSMRFSASRAARGMIAGLIHLSGCRDEGVSMGYPDGGAFTLAMMKMLKDKGFQGNLESLHEGICERIDSTQKPAYSEEGNVSDAFRAERAFR